MATPQNRKPTPSGMSIARRVNAETAPEDNIVSETDEKIKELVEQQLSKDVSIGSLRERFKTFTEPAILKPSLSDVKGTKSLTDYSHVEEEETQAQLLRDCNLTDDEIKLWLEHKRRQVPGKKRKKISANPEILTAKLQEIEKLLAERETRIAAQTEFSASQTVSRHKMELEKALNQGRSEKNTLSSLVMKQSTNQDNPNHPVSQLKVMSEELNHKRAPIPDYGNPYPNPWVPVNERLPVLGGFIGPHPKDYDLDVSDEAIAANKLTIDEIRQLAKFSNYAPGDPTEILYVKNLHSSVKESHLIHLFSRFYIPGDRPITCKLMSGRMRGQAFITCQDQMTASRCLHGICGYKLKGRPMIISYSQPKTSSTAN